MEHNKLSQIGQAFSQGAGVIELMDDLGSALSVNADMLMLGGGNPGHIRAVSELFHARMREILDTPGAFNRLVGNYGAPQGDANFNSALAALLRREFGWQVQADNIAVTNGSQSATFMLFNLLAGTRGDGSASHVCLPLAPEYIGYADQGLAPNFFRSVRPTIEPIDETLFKYRVDFDRIHLDENTAAICASRPTNPTGNVLTDDEVNRLSTLAKDARIPLIIDAAYGLPFPHIVFTEVAPIWDEHMVLCLSLSKIGLPGVRTGIIVASVEIARAITGMNAIMNLTTGGFGPALVQKMVESGDIIRISKDLVRPFYEERADRAVAQLRSELAGYKLRIHKPEGAIFLWLWFEDLPIDCTTLYERLKQRGVLVLSGHYFFPGLPGDWRHSRECIRVTYSQELESVERGLSIIAEEVRRAYDGA